jgi:L,D-peptidoglycan transpeptidase YkuD (ErfK/YbiS/YcfS/YnhG family)
VLALAATAAASTSAPATAGRGPRFAIPARADQLIVVSSPTYDPAPPGYLATLRTYERAGRRAPWRRAFAAWPAETGYGHLRGVRHEGDGSTPTGVFAIGATMYGNKPNPGRLHYAYHRLVCGDWWDEDPYSAQYNRFVHAPCGVTPGFAAGSEALWTETVAYPYLAVLQFNAAPIVAGAHAPGSGIFLHSWVGGATAGCIALPEARLLEVLRWLRPSAHPVIEIGVEREVTLPPTASPAGLSSRAYGRERR